MVIWVVCGEEDDEGVEGNRGGGGQPHYTRNSQ